MPRRRGKPGGGLEARASFIRGSKNPTLTLGSKRHPMEGRITLWKGSRPGATEGPRGGPADPEVEARQGPAPPPSRTTSYEAPAAPLSPPPHPR